jgi:hypothetical protein
MAWTQVGRHPSAAPPDAGFPFGSGHLRRWLLGQVHPVQHPCRRDHFPHWRTGRHQPPDPHFSQRGPPGHPRASPMSLFEAFGCAPREMAQMDSTDHPGGPAAVLSATRCRRACHFSIRRTSTPVPAASYQNRAIWPSGLFVPPTCWSTFLPMPTTTTGTTPISSPACLPPWAPVNAFWSIVPIPVSPTGKFWTMPAPWRGTCTATGHGKHVLGVYRAGEDNRVAAGTAPHGPRSG